MRRETNLDEMGLKGIDYGEGDVEFNLQRRSLSKKLVDIFYSSFYVLYSLL